MYFNSFVRCQQQINVQDPPFWYWKEFGICSPFISSTVLPSLKPLPTNEIFGALKVCNYKGGRKLIQVLEQIFQFSEFCMVKWFKSISAPSLWTCFLMMVKVMCPYLFLSRGSRRNVLICSLVTYEQNLTSILTQFCVQ